MRISIIAAVAENGVIGRAGRLPWHLAADLQRFRELTMNHAIIMGRKTWESIGRPLAGRRMIVVTRQPGYVAEAAEVVGNLDNALALARAAGDDEAFIIGGAEVYRHALPLADRFYLTMVHAAVEGDALFPPFDESAWRQIASDDHPADERNDFPFTFRVLERSS